MMSASKTQQQKNDEHESPFYELRRKRKIMIKIPVIGWIITIMNNMRHK